MWGFNYDRTSTGPSPSSSLPLCIPKGVWAGPCVWPSVPPADCPFPPSTLLQGVSFNGTFGSFPTTSADTWYASPGPNGTLFSAFADGHACTSDGGVTPAPLPPDLVALQWWWSVGAQDNVLSTAAFPPSNTNNSYGLVGVLGYALAGSGGGGGGSNTTFCELALWRGGANSEYWTTCGAEEEAAATAAHYTLIGRLNASLPTSPHHAPDLRPLPPTTPIDMPSGTKSGWAPSAQFYSIARNDHFASPEPIPAGYVLQRGMGEMLLHFKDCVTVSGETQTQGFALLQQPQGGKGGGGGGGEGLFNLTVLSVGTVPHPPQNFPGLSIPPPYGVYPSTAFAYKGLWAYGYYLLADPSGAGCSNWCHMGPLLAFAISTNSGRSFSYPGSSLWGEGSSGDAGAGAGARGVFEPLNVSYPMRLGVPRFVDLGLDLEHSPDGRAYLVGKGCDANDGVHCSFMTGDSAFLARTAQTMEVVAANASALNDPLAWEFWGGEGGGWVDSLANAHPIFAWPGAVGGITMTYNAPLQRFIAIVNLPSDRIHPTDCEFDTYVLESQAMTGPFSMVSFMHALGPQMYFQHASSSGWSEDGLQGVLFSSGNWDGACIKQGSNPPGERYGLVTTQFGLVMK